MTIFCGDCECRVLVPLLAVDLVAAALSDCMGLQYSLQVSAAAAERLKTQIRPLPTRLGSTLWRRGTHVSALLVSAAKTVARGRVGRIEQNNGPVVHDAGSGIHNQAGLGAATPTGKKRPGDDSAVGANRRAAGGCCADSIKDILAEGRLQRKAEDIPAT